MKTPHLLILSLGIVVNAHAGSATWKPNPTSGDWNTAMNWTPATIPNGASDVASFDVSNLTDVAATADIEVQGIVFNPGASQFMITAQPDVTLTISGSGIANNSGVAQEFISENAISFANNATAGEASHFTARSADDGGLGGATEFHNLASAAGSSFVNQATVSGGGTTLFYDDSTAGNGNFVNEASVGGGNGRTQFFNNATAGNSTFTNNGGLGFVTGGGATEFFDSSSAGNATFTVNGGSPDSGIGGGGAVFFFDESTADHCTIIANGGNGRHAFGGGVLFQGTSSAGNATLIANGGLNGGRGGSIGLKTDGGTARIEVFGNGILATGGIAPGVTVGSIEGDGIVDAGHFNLTVGTNDLSTTFSGTIKDTSLFKIGRGTLNLSGGTSFYTGGTMVNAGALEVSNTTGSATGTGAVGINAGTLKGGGIIAGPVTIGAGNGAGAFLAPSQGSGAPTTLTIQSALAFKADGTCIYRVNTKKAKSDQVVANGVAIESGAQFALKAVANKKLPAGQVFAAIINSAATPIAGTFANLADDSTITIGGNTFQADYEGGDGNDLTLTVVP